MEVGEGIGELHKCYLSVFESDDFLFQGPGEGATFAVLSDDVIIGGVKEDFIYFEDVGVI